MSKRNGDQRIAELPVSVCRYRIPRVERITIERNQSGLPYEHLLGAHLLPEGDEVSAVRILQFPFVSQARPDRDGWGGSDTRRSEHVRHEIRKGNCKYRSHSSR